MFVLCFTDLLPEGPPTKGIDRSFTSEPVRSQRDEFLFVKCTDMGTLKAVKATSRCEMIFFDPDGEELQRSVATGTQDIVNAMKSVPTSSFTVIASLCGVKPSMNELECSATVSTTSVSPSQRPVEYPAYVGSPSTSGDGLRPSRYTRRSASFSSLKNVILSAVCITSIP